MTVVLSYIDDLYVKSLEHREEGDKDKKAIEKEFGSQPAANYIAKSIPISEYV